MIMPSDCQLLSEARALLTEPGVWVKGYSCLFGTHGHDCALTAITTVCGRYSAAGWEVTHKAATRCFVVLQAAAERRAGRDLLSVSVYNDSSRTTLEDILSVYDDAIAHADDTSFIVPRQR